MAEPQTKADTTLRLRRTFAAPRETVFRAWTSPEAITRWWIPFEGFGVPAAEVDLRAGGRYRIAMRNAAGEVFHLGGVYRDVVAPERLVYTWRWELPSMDVGETEVTVEFRDLGESTEVLLTHALFPTVEARDNHRQGWIGTLDHLGKIL